jgi:HPt (histidine-containing phosphotransfer) domain-containing protein
MDQKLKTEIEVDPEIADLIPLFLNARSKDVDQLGVLSQQSNFDEMAKICHTIKGIARPYGFPSLESLAIEMEKECKNKNSNATTELLARMQEFVKEYRAS